MYITFRITSYICIALCVNKSPTPDNYLDHSPVLTVTAVNSSLSMVLDDANTVLSGVSSNITESAGNSAEYPE